MRRTSGEVNDIFPRTKNILFCLKLSSGDFSCLKVKLHFTRDKAFYWTTVFIPGDAKSYFKKTGAHQENIHDRNNPGDLIFCHILDWMECCASPCDAWSNYHAQFFHNFQWIQIQSPGKTIKTRSSQVGRILCTSAYCWGCVRGLCRSIQVSETTTVD